MEIFTFILILLVGVLTGSSITAWSAWKIEMRESYKKSFDAAIREFASLGHAIQPEFSVEQHEQSLRREYE